MSRHHCLPRAFQLALATTAILLILAAPGQAVGPLPIKLCQPMFEGSGRPVLDRSSDPVLGQFYQPKVNGWQRLFVQATAETDASKRLHDYLTNSPEFRRSLELLYLVRQTRYALQRQGKLPGGGPKPSSQVLEYSKGLLTQPVVVLTEKPEANFGFSMLSIDTVITDPTDPSRKALAESPEVFIFVPLPNRPMATMIEQDLLDLLAVHEMAHGAMFEAYGPRFDGLTATFRRAHELCTISHGSFALVEGWAEAVAAWVDPTCRLGKRAAAEARKLLKADYYFDCNDKVRREFYLWVHPEQRDGWLKNASQMLATEGIVATILYDLLSNRKLVAADEKILCLMITRQPANLAELIGAWVRDYPADAPTVLRILLETTRYATMDRKIALAYADYWQKHRAFTQRKVTREVFDSARKGYEEAKEKAFKAALAGADPFAAVGPRVGFYGAGYSGDLNLVDADTLVRYCSIEKEDAEKVVAAREAMGYFEGNALDQIIAAIGPETWKQKYARNLWQNQP